MAPHLDFLMSNPVERKSIYDLTDDERERFKAALLKMMENRDPNPDTVTS